MTMEAHWEPNVTCSIVSGHQVKLTLANGAEVMLSYDADSEEFLVASNRSLNLRQRTNSKHLRLTARYDRQTPEGRQASKREWARSRATADDLRAPLMPRRTKRSDR